MFRSLATTANNSREFGYRYVSLYDVMCESSRTLKTYDTDV